ncbi:prolyl oligopeptidase family serine peptidase [Pseudoalteromonas sp. B193]
MDGVKFLISNGTVNKNNICIMGSSFGAYSALQSAILEPDMFKCAIGTVGIYDLPLMFEEGDISGRSTGQNYLENVLGTDETLLKAFSPSYNIDKLKAAVFIVHAGEDARALLNKPNH